MLSYRNNKNVLQNAKVFFAMALQGIKTLTEKLNASDLNFPELAFPLTLSLCLLKVPYMNVTPGLCERELDPRLLGSSCKDNR